MYKIMVNEMPPHLNWPRITLKSTCVYSYLKSRKLTQTTVRCLLPRNHEVDVLYLWGKFRWTKMMVLARTTQYTVLVVPFATIFGQSQCTTGSACFFRQSHLEASHITMYRLTSAWMTLARYPVDGMICARTKTSSKSANS